MEIPVKFLIGFDLFFMVGDGRTNRGGGQGLDLTCALDWDSLVDATPPSFSWADSLPVSGLRIGSTKKQRNYVII